MRRRPGSLRAAGQPPRADVSTIDIHSEAATERLLEDSWQTRSRRLPRRELISESAAGALFVVAATALLLLPGATAGFEPGVAAVLVGVYVALAAIEFPVGGGNVVPTQLALVPMLVLLPPAAVPILVAIGLVLAKVLDWMRGAGGRDRVVFAIPDAWHAIGPAVVLVAVGARQLDLGDLPLLGAAFACCCLLDAASALLRETAARGIAPTLQLRVLALVWVVDACLAPIGFLAAEVARANVAAVLLVLPLAALLGLLARDRRQRIDEAQRRLEIAVRDPLTGLGNRRKLAADAAGWWAAGGAPPRLLMLFDLDGFKVYNDTFGHLAGDALLGRLGAKLEAEVAGRGGAYRLGGDEFCVALEAEVDAVEESIAAVVVALTERGEHFSIGTSYGVVLVPHEADSLEYALQLADERMYAHKHGRSSAASEQARGVLMSTMDAKQPALREHSTEVAQLAVAVARRLGLTAEETDEVARAAELHDVGKVGIPDAILNKPGPLNADEWEFMRQHTILGERILSAAAALRPVAQLVRSSHERWDGRGYPDGLQGNEIPRGSRIVAVCDAYEAMTSDRPYRRAMSPAVACAELLAMSGTQFDPDVVDAFVGELADRAPAAAPADQIDRPVKVVAERVRSLLAASG
jgi:diguanylate cyclase (GGDEF)-like protein